MSKISLDEVEAALLRQKIEPAKVSSIVKELQQVIEENQGEKPPKEKWEYVVVLKDAGNIDLDRVSAWVIQQKEGQDANTILSRLQDAAKDQNEAATKKKNMLSTIGDIFQGLKTKFLTSRGIRIKTKEVVRVLITK